jgi:hypothetical protein
MEEVSARAALVAEPEVGTGLTTSVSREEAEEALRAANGSLELILDLTRFDDGEPAETRSIAVEWNRADLERILSETEGDRVTLTFNGEALREAFEADVEAHGIRDKALVLTVAAVAGVSTAAGASAMPLSPDDRNVPVGQQVTQSLSPDDRAVPRATVAEPQLSPDDRAVSRATPTPDPSLSPDDRAVPRATPTAAPSLSPDDRAVPRATPTAAPSLSPDDRAVPRATPTAAPSLSPDDRAVPRATPAPEPVAAPGGGGVSWPSPAETALIAGMMLAITGAAFAVARRRPGSPRPT